MNRDRHQRQDTWRPAVQLAVLALVVRAAIPLGYMPGNVFAGEFMVLCPTGIPAAFMEAITGHQHGHGGHTIDADRDCPIGSALKPSWAPNDHQVSALDVTVARFDTPTPDTLSLRPASRQYHARAPPIL